MIGVIDSGTGGLHVVAALLKRLPAEDIVYYADTARAPYGSRSAETIVSGALEGAERLRRSGAAVLVAASHAIATVAFDALAQRFGEAFFDVASVAAELAIAVSRRKRIGLVASRATVDSRRYEELIRRRCPQAELFTAACPLWTPLVEEGWLKRRETALIVKRGVRGLKLRAVDTLILGSSRCSRCSSVKSDRRWRWWTPPRRWPRGWRSTSGPRERCRRRAPPDSASG